MKIIVKKGLDIPLSGKPKGAPQHLLDRPTHISLNLDPFDSIRFKVHVTVGANVKIGQPLAESKALPGQMFVSPAAGVVAEIRRGEKRRLLDIVIQVSEKEEYEEFTPLEIEKSSKHEILNFFMRYGLIPHIRLRPFNLLPDLTHLPRSIFVTALETRPFEPPFEMQIKGYEEAFQFGLNTLSKLTSGKVHLVYSGKTECQAFSEVENVEKHQAYGPHPAGSSSLHIHRIAPIRHPEDFVWTLTALDVLVIGIAVLERRYFIDRILSIAGSGVKEGKGGYFRARMGYPIQNIVTGRSESSHLRYISGDPLTGSAVEADGFMGFYHNCLTLLPDNTSREAFHFLRFGRKKFSATRTYLSGHIKSPKEGYHFTTNQHGEERPFVDGDLYRKVMPMKIPTMHLIKAILAEDFELAQELGLLEVVPEDFALSAFICPSKIDMIAIVKRGLGHYAKEMGL